MSDVLITAHETVLLLLHKYYYPGMMELIPSYCHPRTEFSHKFNAQVQSVLSSILNQVY